MPLAYPLRSFDCDLNGLLCQAVIFCDHEVVSDHGFELIQAVSKLGYISIFPLLFLWEEWLHYEEDLSEFVLGDRLNLVDVVWQDHKEGLQG